MTNALIESGFWPQFLLVLQSTLLITTFILRAYESKEAVPFGGVCATGGVAIFVFVMPVLKAWFTPEWYFGVVLVAASVIAGTVIACSTAYDQRR